MNENANDDRHQMKSSDDGVAALILLVVILCCTAIFGAYVWKNKAKLLGIKDRPINSSAKFVPPPNAEKYEAAKMKLDLNKPEEYEELKKMLMHRAMSTIPFILSLQNDGQAIESLYKKGILTDEMHDRVHDVKTFCDAEYLAVKHEADDFKEGWGEEIWPQAMHFHRMRVEEMEAQKALEKNANNAMKVANNGFGAGSPAPRSSSSSPKPGTPNFMSPNSKPAIPDDIEARKARAAAMEKQLLEVS